MDKYKRMVEQRIVDKLGEWADMPYVEEKEIFRFLHNLKGTAGTVGMTEIQQEAEKSLDRFSEAGAKLLTRDEWWPFFERLAGLAPGPRAAGTPAESASHDRDKYSDGAENRVLVIDDDVELAAYLKELLEGHSYPVSLALTAERGMKLFYDWKPDLILVDIILPDENGLEVLSQIVEKSKQDQIPIIVISVENTRENRLRAYRAGAMDFFPKPLDPELLVAVIDNRFRMKRKWERSVIVDELTGAYNRKFFNRAIARLLADYNRSGRVFAVVIMDLDRFKRVNDTYGHLKGDEVLQTFVTIVQRTIREEDMLCRFGGEEFALLLPNTRCGQAAELTERVRAKFNAHRFDNDGQTFQVTFSAGVTETGQHNGHPKLLIDEADQALYAGKQGGRNRTMLYTESVADSVSGQKLNIIIVDDDPIVRSIVVSQFEYWSPGNNIEVAVKEFEDGTRFLESDWYSEEIKYVIMLDGAMPGTDGVDVLKSLRRNYPEKQIVVVMLTGRKDQSDIVKALQDGADDYVVKPFHLLELASRIERLSHRLLN